MKRRKKASRKPKKTKSAPRIVIPDEGWDEYLKRTLAKVPIPRVHKPSIVRFGETIQPPGKDVPKTKWTLKTIKYFQIVFFNHAFEIALKAIPSPNLSKDPLIKGVVRGFEGRKFEGAAQDTMLRLIRENREKACLRWAQRGCWLGRYAALVESGELTPEDVWNQVEPWWNAVRSSPLDLSFRPVGFVFRGRNKKSSDLYDRSFLETTEVHDPSEYEPGGKLLLNNLKAAARWAHVWYIVSSDSSYRNPEYKFDKRLWKVAQDQFPGKKGKGSAKYGSLENRWNDTGRPFLLYLHEKGAVPSFLEPRKFRKRRTTDNK